MEKKSKKSIIIGVVVVLLVTLTLLGLTYAYYRTRVIDNPNEESISVVSKTLRLTYVNGSGITSGVTEIEPGDIIKKSFSVENTGDEIEYGVYLEDVVNEFVNKKDLLIDIVCTSVNTETGEVSGTCNGLTDYKFPENNERILTNTIGVGLTHKYELIFEYYNDPAKDQSDDIGKLLSGEVQIHAVADTYDLALNIAGVESTDIAILNSNPQSARNQNSVYKFTGIELGEHTLKITDKDGVEKSSVKLELLSGDAFSLSGNKIYIPKNSSAFQINARFNSDGTTSINSSGEVTTLESAIKVGDQTFSADNLLEALEASSKENPVKLQKELVLTSNIIIVGDESDTSLKEYYLDLEGFNISCDTCTDDLIRVKRHNTTLTISDGSISTIGNNGALGIGSMIQNTDGTFDKTEQNIKLVVDKDVTITADDTGLYLLGSGVQIDFAGKLTITGDGTGFSGNGNSDGGIINILDGAEINAATQGSYALYLAHKGTTNISGGTITGDTPILIKAGTINMTGGSINAIGAKNSYITSKCKDSTDNFTTGDAILVQIHDIYYKNISINITANANVTSANANVIRAYGCNIADSTAEENIVNVTGKYTTVTIDNEYSNTKLYN